MVKHYYSPKPRLSRRHKNGSFMVEFAIVGLIFAAALAFCSDVVVTLATKGKLDRLAYSGVSLLKERTALFNPTDLTVSQAEFNQLDTISKNTLKRVIGDFDETKYGLRLEMWSPDTATAPLSSGGLACKAKPALTQDMSVVTSWGRRASLYRITVCYEVPSWFKEFANPGDQIVQSSALMIGR